MTTLLRLKRVELHLEERTYYALQQAARDLGLTRSQLVAMIVSEWLRENGYR